ncbi:MAG TPA: glutamate/aspartate ABC transporter substrate-binding protein, partial [Casimicrobiaceae bacterium]|nr:glutamate/aspartate ABC transporter substrate-binding protein [Casimicrobiaceae bacterium]
MTSARSLPAALALCAVLVVQASGALAQDKSKPAPEPVDTLKRIKDSGAITIGVREASVPFSYIDAQKQPQG